MRTLLVLPVLAGIVAVGLTSNASGEPDGRVRADEAKRVAAIEKARPAVVSIFARGGMGGGTGVVITDDGYALTNFHVVEGTGPVMQCGMPDGILYDAVLVGVDKVGDVALVKLLPKKEGDKVVAPKDGKFPVAIMGDSDKLKAGDWSLAMGNPFLLATDFTPTVTFGLVSGVHRYQPPAGILLEYTDCIQMDTSINPGNSGGPLFNMDGELVGINGRGSFDKRGRVNSGVGYAISINQIKNFMGHLRAGLDADHASLGAAITGEVDDEPAAKDEGSTPRLIVSNILEDSDAYRRGLQPGDELLSFAGRPLASVNNFKNVLGLYPRGWRMPLVFRHEEEKKQGEKKETVSEKREILVRLQGVQRRVIEDDDDKKPKQPQTRRPNQQPPTGPAAKLYEAKAGFANYYFNKQERDRLLAGFRKFGDFAKQNGPFQLTGSAAVKRNLQTFKFAIEPGKDRVVLNVEVGPIPFRVEPLKNAADDLRELKDPAGSGGLAVALYHYWQLLTTGPKAFEGGFDHGGVEPLYLPTPDGAKPDYKKQRIDCEVLLTEHIGAQGKWYFDPKDQKLLAFEVRVDKEDDPCEVYLSDYKEEGGRQLPHKMEVRYGNERYAILDLKTFQFSAGK
jgi:S1-C subfamily serine protease